MTTWTQEQFEEACAAYCLGALSSEEIPKFQEFMLTATEEQKIFFSQMKSSAQQLAVAGQIQMPSPQVRENILSSISVATETLDDKTTSIYTLEPLEKPKQNWLDALRGFRFKKQNLSEIKLFDRIYYKLKFNQPTYAVGAPALLLLLCTYFYFEQSDMQESLIEAQKKFSSQQHTVTAQTQELENMRQKLADLESKLTQQDQKVAELEAKATENQSLIAAKTQEAAEMNQIIERNKEFMELMQSNDLRVTEIKGLKPYPQGRGKIFYSPKNNLAYIHISNLPPAPTNKDYELWMFEGKRPVAAGVFAVNQDKFVLAKVTTGLVLPAHKISAFAVTLEAKGGVALPAGPTYLMGNVRL